jgi:hypothetical protein
MDFYNRVKFTTATAGTGTITVGSASSGFRTPAQAGVPTEAKVSYVIEDGADWETGEGVYTVAGTTVTRVVRQSSQADALLNLSGTAVMRITLLAEEAYDVASNYSLNA